VTAVEVVGGRTPPARVAGIADNGGGGSEACTPAVFCPSAALPKDPRSTSEQQQASDRPTTNTSRAESHRQANSGPCRDRLPATNRCVARKATQVRTQRKSAARAGRRSQSTACRRQQLCLAAAPRQLAAARMVCPRSFQPSSRDPSKSWWAVLSLVNRLRQFRQRGYR
jgi:hypothetical protein